jgi:hypothetical protein
MYAIVPDTLPEEVVTSEQPVTIRLTKEDGKKGTKKKAHSVLESPSGNGSTPNLFSHLSAASKESGSSKTTSGSKHGESSQISKGLFSNISNESTSAGKGIFGGLGKPAFGNVSSKPVFGAAASSGSSGQSKGENVSQPTATKNLNFSGFVFGGGGSNAASDPKSATMSRESSPAPTKQGNDLK